MDELKLKPFIRKPHYYETDQMGIIHHANYIRWFEEARCDLLEQLGYGYTKCVESGIDFALLGLSCDYKSMVRYGDTVKITLAVTELTTARLTIRYEVRDAQTDALRTTGETRHCAFDGRRQRPVAIKRALPALYALFEQLLEKESAAPYC